MIPIKDHKNLFRDEKTGAVVNTDTNGYAQYKKMKSAKKSQREELDRIKEDIEEIKLLLKQIASK
tara:strand:- start:34 stop:228 length:195 start_codon:yes stop_codon:yes gene_type:complete